MGAASSNLGSPESRRKRGRDQMAALGSDHDESGIGEAAAGGIHRSDEPDRSDGAPWPKRAHAEEPHASRQRSHTDLSDRGIQLCTQDAIVAIHKRAVGYAAPWATVLAYPPRRSPPVGAPTHRLGIIDEYTSTYQLLEGAELASGAPRAAEPPPSRGPAGPFSPLGAAAAGVAASFRSLVGGSSEAASSSRRGGVVVRRGLSPGAGPSGTAGPPGALPRSTAILDAATQRTVR